MIEMCFSGVGAEIDLSKMNNSDIIVKQNGYIQENEWIVSVDNKLVATIKELVKESGGELPDIGKLLERAIYPRKEDG